MSLSQRQLCEYFGWDYQAVQRGLGGFPHERLYQETIAREAKAKGLSTHAYVQQKTGWILKNEKYYPPARNPLQNQS
ncbi:MAG: hypothetical protein AAF298_24290 [Cyanobacteria bacterium P01_A01_bin.40]